MVECGNNCDCETFLINNKHIKQGQYGMCWFVSILNTILLSDRLSNALKPYINTSAILEVCQNIDNIASHLEKEVSNKPCISDKCSLETIFDIAKYSTNKFFREVLQEFFSNSQVYTLFGPEDYKTGGHPSHIIMPYLVRLGYPSCNIKHVVFNMSHIFSTLFTDPRKIKINRLCQEYLQAQFRHCSQKIEIFIISTVESGTSQYDDIRLQKDDLYLGKFICFIENNKLFSYKLDAVLLTSNNNFMRGSGHAICAITCKNNGFILNSYDPNKKSDNQCSLLPYDWYKWEKNKHFYHTIEQNNTCTGGTMIEPSKLTSNIFNTKKNEFTFNRNVGNNSFIYVRSIHDYTPNMYIESLHTQHLFNTPRHIDEQIIYKEILKPYFYLINEISAEAHIFGIIYEFAGYFPNIVFSLENSVLLQKGIVENGMNMYAYKITVPMNAFISLASLIKECLPDDITLVQSIHNPNQFGLYVQYFRSINTKSPLTPVHGGNK